MAEIVGNDGLNVLTGTAATDTIYGLGGGDLIKGLGGPDTIYGDGRAPGVIYPGVPRRRRLLPGGDLADRALRRRHHRGR